MKHYSKQREAILEVLRQTDTHPTANWIYEKVREKIPNISLGTVYRNLNQLVDEGFITVVETSDKKVHYEGNLNDHIHLLCKECCNITDVFMKNEVPDIFEQTGFKIQSQKTVYYGICKECQNT